MKTLETKRLIFRKFKEEDTEAMYRYAGYAENLPYILWDPISKEQIKEFIHMAILDAEQEPCINYQYAVNKKETDTLIGAANLLLMMRHEAEIGWILQKDYWGQGYGTEIGKVLLQFCFEELHLHRVIARCDTENIGSYRIMEKIGMRREGVFFEGRPANKLTDRQYSDEYAYGILNWEWFRRGGKS